MINNDELLTREGEIYLNECQNGFFRYVTSIHTQKRTHSLTKVLISGVVPDESNQSCKLKYL
jgi:hypothetical protein